MIDPSPASTANTSIGGFILDCSITMSWAFGDERDANAMDILDVMPKIGAMVPTVWHLEVVNRLSVNERRGRIDESKLFDFLEMLEQFPIKVDEETSGRSFRETLGFARTLRLSSYDAAYLECAIRRGLPLATLEAKLRAAAIAVGVPLFDPSKPG